MRSFWKQYFFLPNALTRVNFSLHFCQLEDSSQVRRNNEQHNSDQRKEYMRNAKYSLLPMLHKYTPSREKREKIARILLCTHLPWPHSHGERTPLYTQLPVACKPLWDADGNTISLHCLLNEKEGLKTTRILWPHKNMSVWVVCLLLWKRWCPVSYPYLWMTYKPAANFSEPWRASGVPPLMLFSLAGKTSAFIFVLERSQQIES